MSIFVFSVKTQILRLNPMTGPMESTVVGQPYSVFKWICQADRNTVEPQNYSASKSGLDYLSSTFVFEILGMTLPKYTIYFVGLMTWYAYASVFEMYSSSHFSWHVRMSRLPFLSIAEPILSLKMKEIMMPLTVKFYLISLVTISKS